MMGDHEAMTTAGAGRILILAPHPDDEIVACGIAAMRAGAAGARVFVLYLTTGVPAGVLDRAASWPRHRLSYDARVRWRGDEALAAARLLGLEPVGWRDTPARRLRFDLDGAARDIGTAIAACRPEALWVPAFEGAHQDHDAANALAAAVAVTGDPLPVREFAAYNFAGGRVGANRFAAMRGGEVAIDATRDEAQRKRQALGCYASERGNLGHVGAGREAFRPLPAHDYSAWPHPGRLFRERFHWVPFRYRRIDFDPSAEIYRDIAAWISARRQRRGTVLDDGPGGEAGQADREFARPLDEAEGKRAVGRQTGDAG
jgi:LmbE family N-acetylglucosaminyl deacetylase